MRISLNKWKWLGICLKQLMVKNSFIEMTYVEGAHWKHLLEVSSGAKIRNRYNQVLHLTQDTNGKVTNSQLDTTNESQEVTTPSPQQATIRQFQCIPTTYVTEHKEENYLAIYIFQVSCPLSLPLLNIPNQY